jgi:hypothetical protein
VIRVTQIVDGSPHPNLVNPDLVERVIPLGSLGARTLHEAGALSVLKMQSGDTLYIQETLEQYEEKIK